ncbi:MAG: hypothetical protein NTZ78_04560 [Candidatus Aureabacteria bacterium]|nr:hypothetical protein [Candidatus Auribacterota bacterium]
MARPLRIEYPGHGTTSQAAGTSGGRYPGTTRTGSGAAVTNNHMRLQKQMFKDRRLAKWVKQIRNKLVSV